MRPEASESNARFFIQMALDIVTHINVWAHIHSLLRCPLRSLKEVAPKEFHPLKAPRWVAGLGGDRRRPDKSSVPESKGGPQEPGARTGQSPNAQSMTIK